jgi:hypothetical protein
MIWYERITSGLELRCKAAAQDPSTAEKTNRKDSLTKLLKSSFVPSHK